MVDYRSLLIRYAAMILAEEGIHFLDFINRCYRFSAEELEGLKAIAKEVEQYDA